MEAVERLLSWAATEGIVIDGIAPKKFLDRGIGIVAKRNLKKGDKILTVPGRLLRTIENTPDWIIDPLKTASTHAVLAAGICLERDPYFSVWKGVFPTPAQVDVTHPLRWPLELRDLLPHCAKLSYGLQEKKFLSDWETVEAAFPEITKDDFMYAWILVNTRSFYHNAKVKRPGHEDRMAMQPVTDLFNHSSDGCTVTHDEEGFTVRAAKDHFVGDELFIRYGAHNNDYLLVEYGFVLPDHDNIWDETSLDPYLCTRFTLKQAAKIEEKNYWGGYKLDTDNICYRTAVAMKLLMIPEEEWDPVLEGKVTVDENSEEINNMLLDVANVMEEDINRMMRNIDISRDGEDGSREMLIGRWRQMQALILSTINRLERPRWD